MVERWHGMLTTVCSAHAERNKRGCFQMLADVANRHSKIERPGTTGKDWRGLAPRRPFATRLGHLERIERGI